MLELFRAENTPTHLIRVMPAEGLTASMNKICNEPVYVFGNSTVAKDSISLVKNYPHPVIGADGGADVAFSFGIIPDVVIGDLDSLADEEAWRTRTSVFKVSEQNSTDLEKVLTYVKAPAYLAFGFTDKRFDHTLEILHITHTYVEKQLVFFSQEDVIFRIPEDWNAMLPAGTRFSIYPLEESEITEGSGFKYDIHGLNMKQGTQIGTSNETIKPEISIKYRSGVLLGICPLKHTESILQSLHIHL